MKKNEISPLMELRREKEIVRHELNQSEERLADHWGYFSDNASSLIINGAISGIAGWMGFSHKKEKPIKTEGTGTASNGIFQNVLGTLTANYPLIWEIVRPMLIRFAINKVKSLFTGKKKED